MKWNVLPLIRQIAFERNTEDSLQFNRDHQGNSLLGPRYLKEDLNISTHAKQALDKRRKEVDVDVEATSVSKAKV